MIRAALFLALATPAQAFEIDYKQVFDTNTDTITRTGETTRRLDLPPHVHVVETTLSDGTITYFGYDDSQTGAAGCTFGILVDLTVAAQICPGMLDAAATQTLADHLDTAARFVAANTIPPVPPEDIPTRLKAHVDARVKALSQSAQQCDPSGDPQMMSVIRAATSPSFRNVLNQIHAVPRLPVSSPCM